MNCRACGHTASDHGRIPGVGCMADGCTCGLSRKSLDAEAARAVPTQRQADQPDLPYAGTSGWSGSVTSQARAILEDGDGTTTQRQAEVLAYLEQRGHAGATWTEVAQAAGWHHGQASGTLSVLHKVGRIVRLFGDGTPSTCRNRCAVYVLPQYVGHRQAAEHGRKRPTTSEAERDAARRLRGLLAQGMVPNVARADLADVLDALDRLA